MSKIYVDEIAGIASADTVAIPGHVIQVVQGTRSGSSISTTSTSLSDTGLSVSITPTAASSKIVVMATLTGGSTTEPGNDAQAFFQLVRDTTDLIQVRCGDHNGNASRSDDISPINLSYLDSPATTSATTYKVQYKVNGSGRTAQAFLGSQIGSIIAMEIAG